MSTAPRKTDSPKLWGPNVIFYQPKNADELDAETPLFTKDELSGHDPDLCTDGECVLCGVLQCPFGEPLHWDADGCPVCDCP